jgi:small neutral amino acid transporter SnatA (MarC family)
MAMGPYLIPLLTPRLRFWLGQSQELVLQSLIGLLIIAVAMLILVTGLRTLSPGPGLKGAGWGREWA